MSDKPSLSPKVEALRELKGQYYIGSQPAFKYMKAMTWYERVRDEVMRDPAVQGGYKPTVREIAALISAIRMVIEYWLNYLAVKASTPEDLSLTTHHDLIKPREILERGDPAIPYRDTTCGTSSHLWEFDDVLFLRRLLAFTPSDMRERVVRSIGGIEAFLGFTTGMGVLLPMTGHDVSFLTCPETGEKISFSQFSANPKFRRGNEEWFWLGFQSSISDIDEFLEEVEDTEEDAEEDDPWDFRPEHPDPAQDALLLDAWERKDLAASHHIIHPLAIHRAQRDIQSIAVAAERCLQAQEVKAENWLYYSGLYHRAKQEHILRHLEIERRIALSEVHSTQYIWYEDSTDPVALVDATIRHRADEVRRTTMVLGHSRSIPGMPEFIHKQHEEDVQRAKDIYNILRKNRAWLIEFFSR